MQEQGSSQSQPVLAPESAIGSAEPSAARHTPGPWTIEQPPARGAWVQGSNGEWAALACGDNDRTAAANARLIAASPDLLTALRDLLRHYVELVNSGDCGNWNPETEIVVKDARAAIAKAVQS